MKLRWWNMSLTTVHFPVGPMWSVYVQDEIGSRFSSHLIVSWAYRGCILAHGHPVYAHGFEHVVDNCGKIFVLCAVDWSSGAKGANSSRRRSTRPYPKSWNLLQLFVDGSESNAEVKKNKVEEKKRVWIIKATAPFPLPTFCRVWIVLEPTRNDSY